MNPNTFVAVVGLLMALVMNAFAVFRYVAGIKEGLLESIARESIKADTKIDAVSRDLRLFIEKIQDTESKSRQELTVNVTSALTETRRDNKMLDEKINLVQREMIRRADIAELRHEIMAALDRQDRTRTEGLEKLEKRVEAMVAKRVAG